MESRRPFFFLYGDARTVLHLSHDESESGILKMEGEKVMPYKKRKKREKRSDMKETGESMEALGAKHFPPPPPVPPALPTPDEFPWGSEGSKSFYFFFLSLSVAEIKGMPCLHAYISAAVIVVLCGM